MKKVLITGSNGFVGQHLQNILKDYFLIGLTHGGDLTDTENSKFYNGNILDSHFLEEIISKHQPDYIIHLAAIAPTHFKDAEQVFKINLLGTNNLYQAVIKYQTADYNPKILYISSAEVYGKTNHPEKIVESDALNPLNYYGTSKLAADKLTTQLAFSHQLNTLVIRPFNHTGPLQGPGFFVPDMISQIVDIEQKNKDAVISVGNLESTRDISDVRDIVMGYKTLMENNTQPGDVYNLCSGQCVVMKDLLNQILTFSKVKIQITQDPEKMRPSDNPISVGNHDKITQQFGWQPEFSLEQTLKDTFDYWRSRK